MQPTNSKPRFFFAPLIPAARVAIRTTRDSQSKFTIIPYINPQSLNSSHSSLCTKNAPQNHSIQLHPRVYQPPISAALKWVPTRQPPPRAGEASRSPRNPFPARRKLVSSFPSAESRVFSKLVNTPSVSEPALQSISPPSSSTSPLRWLGLDFAAFVSWFNSLNHRPFTQLEITLQSLFYFDLLKRSMQWQQSNDFYVFVLIMIFLFLDSLNEKTHLKSNLLYSLRFSSCRFTKEELSMIYLFNRFLTICTFFHILNLNPFELCCVGLINYIPSFDIGVGACGKCS